MSYEDIDLPVEEEWVIDPATVHVHVGHHIEIVVYAERNLAIQCEDCGTIIGDIDFWGTDMEGRLMGKDTY